MEIINTHLEVLFSPAEFEALSRRDLGGTVCVVFDILRATSSMVMALANGASGILPVADIPAALRIRAQQPMALLAGERDGFRIRADLTGSIDFDLGNSPREFKRDKVAGEFIVMTTTNGTRALKACAGARKILVGSFLNLHRVAAWVAMNRPPELVLVCSGTHEEAALEDTLAAGALCESVWPYYEERWIADSALIARQVYLTMQSQLPAAVAMARNGRRLLSIADLRDDVAVCLLRDTINVLAEMGRDGVVRAIA
ncbi:MAG: 2-phosphosulfolactate phosphatase [Verrucomicrobiota bacterium]